MALASDGLPDWSAADDVPHEAQLHSESAHEQGAPPGNLYVKRVEMLNAQEEEESYETEQEADAAMGNYERQLNQVRDSFDPSSPRAQTDLSDAVPRLAFMDHPSEELYWPILDSSGTSCCLTPMLHQQPSLKSAS